MVRIAKEAARLSEADIEVVDLLTLWPWDRATVRASATRTGRLATLEEAPRGTGWGGDVVSAIASDCFGLLAASPHRITLPDAPVPYNGVLEARYLPSPAYVARQIDALVATGRAPLPWWEERA
jgi:pyruvate/2-oxoglutarate/acetoin dehydrogenase E1 component